MTYAIYFKEFGVSLLKVRNFCYKIDWVSLQLEGRLKNMCYRGGGGGAHIRNRRGCSSSRLGV